MSGPKIPNRRGSHINPPNRFDGISIVPDYEHLADDPDFTPGPDDPRTEYIPDRSRTVVTENDSPDVGFRYSINPYRGCSHGCCYCYARITHEYLGYNAGLDFESKIMVKHEAPELFRAFLANPRWVPELVAMSGVTDCYQPAEHRFRLTRGCLEVAAEARLPISIITKNALVVRDVELLRQMAAANLVHVNISITSLDPDLIRTMEPRTSNPAGRLRAVKVLSDAGVPVRVLIAPVVPALNDLEIPAILKAAKEAGAMSASYTLLRLPLTVAPVFLEWLNRSQTGKAFKVENRLRETRGGRLNDSEFGRRMSGTGDIADNIGGMFDVFARRFGLDGELPPYDFSHFRRPQPQAGQMFLF